MCVILIYLMLKGRNISTTYKVVDLSRSILARLDKDAYPRTSSEDVSITVLNAQKTYKALNVGLNKLMSTAHNCIVFSTIATYDDRMTLVCLGKLYTCLYHLIQPIKKILFPYLRDERIL